MSRSNYSDYCDGWGLIRWRGAVKSAIKGLRGQAFLRELLAAFEAMPEKRLIAAKLEQAGEVCALGALGRQRGIDQSALDPEDYEAVAKAFGIADAMTREIVYMNDEGSWGGETPEQRWQRMRAWVVEQIRDVSQPDRGSSPKHAEPSND